MIAVAILQAQSTKKGGLVIKVDGMYGISVDAAFLVLRKIESLRRGKRSSSARS